MYSVHLNVIADDPALDSAMSPPRLETTRFSGPPIFISGCNRGGTTVAAQLIAAHPEVVSIGRGQFHEGQYIWRRKFPDWSRHRWALAPWRWYLRRTERHVSPELTSYFHREFHDAMSRSGRMLEKTPANAVRIPFINRLYPDCYFVHVIRDGRHTTASLVARKVRLSQAPHQWVNAHRIALSDLSLIPKERVVTIEYEKMLTDPGQVLGDLFHRCGLKWGGSEQQALLSTASELLKQPASRWDDFTGSQQKYVLSVIGDLQRELGYPVEP